MVTVCTFKDFMNHHSQPNNLHFGKTQNYKTACLTRFEFNIQLIFRLTVERSKRRIHLSQTSF